MCSLLIPREKTSHAEFLTLKFSERGNDIWYGNTKQNIRKTFLPKPSHPRKILAKFSGPKKIPESKIFLPKKSFYHYCSHLKSWVPPWVCSLLNRWLEHPTTMQMVMAFDSHSDSCSLMATKKYNFLTLSLISQVEWTASGIQLTWLTMTSISLDVKFFTYTHGFFIWDCTPGYNTFSYMYPNGLLVISSAELGFLSYWSGGITLNSVQSLSCKVNTVKMN